MSSEVPAQTVHAPPLRAGSGLPYLPGLDGLRALAVSAVLIYHAGIFDDSAEVERGVQWLRGGFLGVEVFFVISGYLITALLLIEHRSTGTTDFRAFWMRRARRLLPALYAVLVFWTLYAVVFLRDEVARLRGDIVAGVFYVSNWYQIDTGSYVGNTMELNGQRPSLFKHLWSLAVEEQYYIVWPVLVLVGFRYLGRERMRRWVAIGAGLSVAWMAALTLVPWLPGAVTFEGAFDPTRIYEGTDTRAAGLLFGSWLAFVWTPNRIRGHIDRRATMVLDTAGAIALIWLFRLHQTVGFTDAFLYRGGLFLVAGLTGVLIVVTVHPASHFGALLGNSVFRWVGLRSYGIYLWHWPIFQVTRPELDVPIHGVANVALRLALTIVTAELSYRFIEMPVRTGRLGELVRQYHARADEGTDVTALSELVGESPAAHGQRRRHMVIAVVAAVILVGGGFSVVRAEMPPCDPDIHPTGCLEDTVDNDVIPSFTTPTSPVPTETSAADPSGTTVATNPTGPTTTSPPANSRNVIAIGDSVMLGAAEKLTQTFPGIFVDAEVSRAPVNGVARIEQIAAAGGLNNVDVVIIHLGTNGRWGDDDFDRLMRSLSDVPLVIAVNSRVPRTWQGEVNNYLRAKAEEYDTVRLFDWNKLGNTPKAIGEDWFADDGYHLNATGRQAYADGLLNLIVRAGQ